MKTKSLLLAIAVLLAGALTAQTFAPATVTVSLDELRYRASLNRNLADALAPVSERGAAYFAGKADAFAEIAALNQGGVP